MRTHIMLWLFMASIVPITLLFVFTLKSRLNVIKQESFLRLIAIRDLKVQYLNQWLDERSEDISVLAKSISHHIAEGASPSVVEKELRMLFELYHAKNNFYDEIFLINIDTGNIWLSNHQNQEGTNKSGNLYFTQALNKDIPYIKDAYLSDTTNIPTMSFSIPVYEIDNHNKMLAILVIKMNMTDSLFKILNNHTALGITGETLVVTQDNISINQLKVKAKLAINASNGKTGIIESKDYRDVMVLAAYTYLPKTGWGFIAKQDLNEIYAPLYRQAKKIIIAIILLILSIFIIAVFLSKKITQPIIDMALVAKRIQSGDSQIRNTVRSKNELGFLAKSFNEMADSLEIENKTLKSYLQNIITSMPSALLGVNDKSQIILWNAAAEKMTGKTEEQVYGKSIKNVLPMLLEYSQTIDLVIKKQQQRVITNIKHKIDNKFNYFNITFFPVSDESSSGAVIRLDNVTENYKKDEILNQSQKIDALGNLTGGIAHDFNNILGVINGYAELLETVLIEEPKFLNYAHNISHAGERGAQLTKKLLAFTRKTESEAVAVDLNDFLSGQKDLLQRTLTARIKIELNLQDKVWPVWLDRNDLEDAILNLSINAMHAMESNGRLTFQTNNESLNQHDAFNLALNAGDYVVLNICDTGCGMNEETTLKIFEPFFSTKGEKGTGLGLSQVYGFIERSKGLIKVYSEKDKGTQFNIYFPRYYKNKQEVSTTLQPIDNLNGNETILIVDDELALLDLTREILSSHGYQIFCANSCKEALRILTEESIDLMLSDVIMPNMDGYQLATIVQEQFSTVKIQLVSGFTADLHLHNGNTDLHQSLLKKPLNSQVLLKRVRTLLNESFVS